MNDYQVRKITASECEKIYTHIERDFPQGEYPPYSVLCRQLQDSVQEGLILQAGKEEAAYAICAQSETSGFVLISLLAVYDNFRGQGIGSAFLKELNRIYSGRQGLIVEVETPRSARTPEERDKRIKRIEFYQKAGFILIEGIEYSIWDIPMHLMVRPLSASIETINKKIGQVLYDIYLGLMGKRYIHKMKFYRLDP